MLRYLCGSSSCYGNKRIVIWKPSQHIPKASHQHHQAGKSRASGTVTQTAREETAREVQLGEAERGVETHLYAGYTEADM